MILWFLWSILDLVVYYHGSSTNIYLVQLYEIAILKSPSPQKTPVWAKEFHYCARKLEIVRDDAASNASSGSSSIFYKGLSNVIIHLLYSIFYISSKSQSHHYVWLFCSAVPMLLCTFAIWLCTQMQLSSVHFYFHHKTCILTVPTWFLYVLVMLFLFSEFISMLQQWNKSL